MRAAGRRRGSGAGVVFDQRVLIPKPKRKHTFSEMAKTKESHLPPSARGRPSKQDGWNNRTN